MKNILTMVSLKCIFRIVCVLISVCTIFWPIYLFNLDEDSLDFELKDLHSSKDTPYPGIRLCFARTILDEHKKPYRNVDNPNSQLQNGSNPTTFHIEDFIENIVIHHSNNTRPQLTGTGLETKLFRSIQRNGTFSHIILRRFNASYCLDVASPFKENKGIHSISVEIRKSVFKKDAVPTRTEIMSGTSKLQIGMSLNGDSFRLPSQNSGDLLSNQHSNCTWSNLVFRVNGMETLHRRNKTNSRCIDYDKHGLFNVLNWTENSVGCLPIGWETPNTLHHCTVNNMTKDTIDKLVAALEFFSSFPCRSIQDLQLEYDDSMNACENHNKTLQITAVFDKFLFREIKVVRAYTEWDLTSSIGIIFGMFFGVSLMDVPDMVKKICKKRRRYISRKPSKRRKSQIFILKSLDTIKEETNELNKELQNAKNDISQTKCHMIRLEHEMLVKELQYAKKDISLMKKSLDTVLRKARERNSDLAI